MIIAGPGGSPPWRVQGRALGFCCFFLKKAKPVLLRRFQHAPQAIWRVTIEMGF
ncbi:MAG: hypothetical protein H7836_05870 [Magnetococcus sp. YQC-3]